MRRYKFLNKNAIYGALNRLRAALLAANDGHEVEEIMHAVLTHDERIKIGRRIEVAEMLMEGVGHDEIAEELKVGKSNIAQISRKLAKYSKGFELINKRLEKVDMEYKHKSVKSVGGSKLIFKGKDHTGFTRKDVRR